VGFKLEADALDYLDDAWRAVGVKTRVSFIRTAIIEKLQRMLSETKGEERKAVARALDALGVE
jgi:metal-responsive CopG/Arc/MetJ family transcriptional regulator